MIAIFWSITYYSITKTNRKPDSFCVCIKWMENKIRKYPIVIPLYSIGTDNKWILIVKSFDTFALCEKCPCLEFFCSVFFRIWTEYGQIPRISPYSVQMWENTGQKNSKYRHFLPIVDGSFYFYIKNGPFQK